MKLRIGEFTQLYGPKSRPAAANEMIDKVFNALKANGIHIDPISREIRGPDIWFQVEANIVQIRQVLSSITEIEKIEEDVDEEFGSFIRIDYDIEAVMDAHRPKLLRRRRQEFRNKEN